MTPEIFIVNKAVEAIKDLYGVEVEAGQLQVQVTRKEFESTGRGEEWRKIVIRSLILAPIIVIVFVTVAVLIAIKT